MKNEELYKRAKGIADDLERDYPNDPWIEMPVARLRLDSFNSEILRAVSTMLAPLSGIQMHELQPGESPPEFDVYANRHKLEKASKYKQRVEELAKEFEKSEQR